MSTSVGPNSSGLRRRPPFMLWRLVLREFALPLVCALAAFCMLFLLNDVFDDVSDFAAAAIPGRLLLRYFLAKLPGNLAAIVPVSTLLATSFMTVNLGRNNELGAMRASGLSLAVCAFPVWVVAALLCLAVLLVDERLAARCAGFTDGIRQTWLHKQRKDRLPQFFFANPRAGRDWFFGQYLDPDRPRNCVVRQYGRDRRIESILTAREVRHAGGRWIFRDGLEVRYAPGPRGLPRPRQVRSFAEETRELPETPAVMQLQRKDWSVLNISELLRILRGGMLSSRQARNHLKVMLWHRLTFPLASLVSALLGFSLCIATGRSDLMKGFALAVFLLVAFHVSGQFLLVLGKNGWLPPFAAGAASNLLFLALAVFLTWKRQ